ncbi:MAG: hypothetical protein P8M34_11140 [Saprospiraceae bacterium]|nr:hypothetical protein [Saprospiraceae bacterium]
MKNLFIKGIYFIYIIAFVCCFENKTDIREIALQPGYSQIQNIISIADCSSPFGLYTTEVHSLEDGSCYFVQKFSDTEAPFEVKINFDNVGFLINNQDSIIDTLSLEDVEMIRGHEFHKLSMNPAFFFDDIRHSKSIEFQGCINEIYSGKDGLGNPVSIYYNKRKKLVNKIELLNPKDKSQSIEIIYAKWVPSKYGEIAKVVDYSTS